MKKQSQSGSVHLIVIIVLIIAILGTLGYVYWQNFMPKTDTVANTSDTTSSEAVATTNTSTTTVTGTPVSSEYIVLSDWGVKLQLPANVSAKDIAYYKTNDTSYGFTTPRTEALGGYCSHDNAGGWDSLGVLGRTLTTVEKQTASTQFIVTIGNYDYYYSSPQSVCADDGASMQKIIDEDDPITNIANLIKSIKAE